MHGNADINARRYIHPDSDGDAHTQPRADGVTDADVIPYANCDTNDHANRQRYHPIHSDADTNGDAEGRLRW